MPRRKNAFKKVGRYASGRGKQRKVYQLTRNSGTSKGLFKRGKNSKKAYIPKKYKKYVKSSGIMYRGKN